MILFKLKTSHSYNKQCLILNKLGRNDSILGHNIPVVVRVDEEMKQSRSKNLSLEQTEGFVRSPWKGFSTVSQVFLTSVVGCGWSSKGPAYVNLGD